MPADSRTLDEEGVVIPPTRLDDDVLDDLVARMRNPGRAARRPPRAARRPPARRAAVAELCERRGRDRVAAAMDELFAYSERVVRAAIAALPDGRFEAADVLEATERRPRASRRGRRSPATRSLSTSKARRPARGQPQLPALGDQVGLLLRRPLPDRPGPAGVGGAFAPVTRPAPARLARQRAAAGGGRRRQRRDLVPHRRRLLPRARRRRCRSPHRVKAR